MKNGWYKLIVDGELKDSGCFEGRFPVDNVTEKAFMMDGIWFPKSQCIIKDDTISMPQWLYFSKFGRDCDDE